MGWNVFSENGRIENGGNRADGCFVEEIAWTLQQRPCGNWARVKSEAGWTDTSNKTVKDRFSGAYDPNGSQAIAVTLHSDNVPRALLAMARHEDRAVAITPVHAEAAIENLLDAVHLHGGNTDFQDRIQRPSSANGR